jgi:hypothetical protein
VRELKADGSLPANTKLRSSKYLNNLIEQDHRGVKQRIGPMLGFKQFRNAAITIAGIEMMHPHPQRPVRNRDVWAFRASRACSLECGAWDLKSRVAQRSSLDPAGYLHQNPPEFLDWKGRHRPHAGTQ